MAFDLKRSHVVSVLIPLSLTLLAAGCREGTGSSAGGTTPIPLPAFGANGCNGMDQSFGSLAAVSFASLNIGPMSQLAAAGDTLGSAGTYELYVTGDGATLVELVFDPMDPLNPMTETVLLGPGDVDGLPEYAGVTMPAELSGVAVFDPGFLVVVENTANTLLLMSRDVPGNVSVFPTLVPDEAPGNSDGPAGLIRFAFTSATQFLPTGDGRFLIADPGNHSIRQVEVGALAQSATIAGTGAPFYADGRLTSTGFDTPVGLALTCDGDLVVAESGGHRIRRLSVGDFNFFAGGFGGDSITLVGDGTEATTDGSGATATVAAPVAPVITGTGEIYWVDSTSGILRRYDPDTDTADCPFFADCATAMGAIGTAPNFTSTGSAFSLAVTEDGSLYALDADADELWLVMP